MALAGWVLVVLEPDSRMDNDVIVEELHVALFQHHVEVEFIGLGQALEDVEGAMVTFGQTRRTGVKLAGADVVADGARCEFPVTQAVDGGHVERRFVRSFLVLSVGGNGSYRRSTRSASRRRISLWMATELATRLMPPLRAVWRQ
jgi:hypothetical protein